MPFDFPLEGDVVSLLDVSNTWVVVGQSTVLDEDRPGKGVVSKHTDFFRHLAS